MGPRPSESLTFKFGFGKKFRSQLRSEFFSYFFLLAASLFLLLAQKK
jgi:hypothetical protein